jgi:tetratricopeptide (TPR) repeat protein
MDRVVSAVESGKCALAVSGSLLRDPDVVLALNNRSALNPMALSGPAVSPVVPIGESGVARALAEPGGIIILVEPETADDMGVQQLGRLLASASNKPEVIVVARSFNPFSYVLAMPGLAVTHVKSRGKNWIAKMPIPGELPDAPKLERPKKKGKAKDPNLPKPVFVGREEELAIVGEMLAGGGPIVISGPSGVGKSVLVDHAISASGLKRHVDLVLGRGVGFDTAIARLAAICAAGGDEGLANKLAANKRTATELIETAISSLAGASGCADQVLVISELDPVMGREADFFRKSRLELLLVALLRNTYSLRIVFEARNQPVFYREAAGQHVRRYKVAGLKGRFFHEIFEANRAGEVERERFGPMSERLFGHPLAVKLFALAVRDADNKEAILDNTKFLRMESLDDIRPIQKRLEKRVEKLDKRLRTLLGHVAHRRVSSTGADLLESGLNRKDRLQLIKAGLLWERGTNENRSYGVHRLVSRHLTWREISDFGHFEELAEAYGRRVGQAEGPDKVAWAYEATRCAVQARRSRELPKGKWPDYDALVDSIIGLMRQNIPRVEMAEARLNHILNSDPSNSDAWLMKLEMLTRDKDKKAKEIQEAFDAAMESALVPEILHAAVGWHLRRRARGKAITVLEKGVEALPDESRLRTRLAALLLKQGRRPEGIAMLEKAMELDPMLPDAYGILGMARRDEGAEALPQAEALLREAVRLAPGDLVQVSRLVGMLLDVARAIPERTEACREEAREMLDRVLKGERKSAGAYLTFAELLREQGELDRAEWMVDKAGKLIKRRDEQRRRIRLERARIQTARGELDKAEKALRDMIGQDPSNSRLFEALSKLLEARQLYIPAHAELLRAKERTPPNSLRLRVVDAELLRLQAFIEAQAAGLLVPTPGPVAAELPSMASAPKVIRRKGDSAEADGVDAEAVEAGAVATTAADVEETAEAVEVAVEAAPEAVEAAEVAVEVAPEAVEAAPEAVEAVAEAVEVAPEAVEAAPEAVEE